MALSNKQMGRPLVKLYIKVFETVCSWMGLFPINRDINQDLKRKKLLSL